MRVSFPPTLELAAAAVTWNCCVIRCCRRRMNAQILPNRLLPFTFHFFRQFLWGCLGLLVFPVLGRAIFASIAYATKRLTDTVLAMHNPAAEGGKLVTPFTPFFLLVG